MDWGAWRAIHSMGSQKFRYDWATNTLTLTFVWILTCYLTAKCSLDWGQGAWSLVIWVRLVLLDFPDDLVVGSPHASAGNAGSIPTLGRPHVSWGNWACEPQLWALALQLQGAETARGSPISWTWGTTALWVFEEAPWRYGRLGSVMWRQQGEGGHSGPARTVQARWCQRPAGWGSVVQVTNQHTDTGPCARRDTAPHRGRVTERGTSGSGHLGRGSPSFSLVASHEPIVLSRSWPCLCILPLVLPWVVFLDFSPLRHECPDDQTPIICENLCNLCSVCVCVCKHVQNTQAAWQGQLRLFSC